MTVSWATSAKTATSTVKYGTSTGALTQVATGESMVYLEGGMVHNHVTMEGLKPGATYFYSCGDSAGGFTAPRSFTLPLSAAAAGTPGAPEMKVSILGDWGYGVDGHAVSTRKAFETLKSRVDFFFHLGDISYADDAFLHDVTGFQYENVYSGLLSACSLFFATAPSAATDTATATANVGSFPVSFPIPNRRLHELDREHDRYQGLHGEPRQPRERVPLACVHHVLSIP